MKSVPLPASSGHFLPYPDFATPAGRELARRQRPWLAKLTDRQLAELDIYINLLLQWNRACNLIGVSTAQRVLDELVADSMFLAGFLRQLTMDFSPCVWDFGSGAGLPGIPLRIVWPAGHYIMVEIREKRALFLANALSRLELGNTEVFRGSVADFFRSTGSQFDGHANVAPDFIISKAFMPWQKLLKLVRPMLAVKGALLVLANTPPPLLPGGWLLKDRLSYSVNSKERWFWTLEPVRTA